MKVQEWEAMQREDMNPKMWRKLIYGEKAMLAQISIAKDGVVPLHHHESEQLSYAVKGAMKFELEGKEVVLRAGQVLVIPSNVPHSAVAIEDFLGFDVFSPIRVDWITGNDAYLRSK